MVAFALLASWFLILLWFKQSAQFPLDFDGLWDASEKPRLRARLLGMQTLRSGATIEVVDGNPAFALGGERAVMLGAWPIPRHDSMGSWAAWVKLLQPLPMDVVPFAGTAPPLNWGFGAVDGRPAAWMVQRNLNGEKEVNRIVSENPFPIDEWVHLAVVLTPGRMMLWVNGQLAKDGIYNAANPEDPDVWLGRVRRTLGMLHPANSHAFGLPAPPFLLDDYVHFPRSLTPNEVKAISNAGRDGVARAESRLELLDKLRSHSITAVLISLGFALCGALQTLSSLVMKLFQPVFASVWLILLIGGSLTSWATLKLWRAAARSDADKLDLFADQLRYSSETSFGRIADLLRRARDYVRANPQATLAEMNAWAQENGAVHDYSGIDGIGWAPVVRTDKDRQLPVRAYTGIVAADHDGWFWDGSYEVLRQNVDVAATGLVRLRPTASAEHRDKYGIRLYLPVHDRPLRQPSEDDSLVGVVFVGIDLLPMVRSYWHNLPPLFGARFIPGLPHSRETIAVDTGDLFPATRRPSKPYLEKEIAIRIYGRRIWVRLWTTDNFQLHSGNVWPWTSAVLGSLFTILSATLVGVQAAGRLKERTISAELKESRDALSARQHEREALSRELHDGAIQSLYAVQLQLGRIGSRSSSDADLAAVHAGLSTVIGELREFTASSPTPAKLRPTLTQVLEAIVTQARLATKTSIRLDYEQETALRITELQAVHLANIAREALSNAIRHSAAQNVWLEFKLDSNDNVLLQVSDDGVGFDTKIISTGHGLANMRARAEELGGRIHVESAVCRGTTISISVPVEPQAAEQSDE